MRKWKLAVAAGAIFSLTACSALKPPAPAYAQADVDFERILGKRVEAWILQGTDPVDGSKFSDLDKRAMLLALQTWRAMVAEAADEHKIPHQINPTLPPPASPLRGGS